MFKLKTFLRLFLAVACSWNFIFAEMDGVLVCFHHEVEIHVAIDATHQKKDINCCDHAEHDPSFMDDANVCTDECFNGCSDLILEATYLGPVRESECSAITLPSLVESELISDTLLLKAVEFRFIENTRDSCVRDGTAQNHLVNLRTTVIQI